MSWAIQLAIALAIFVGGGWTGIEWEQGAEAQREVKRIAGETAAIAARVKHHDAAAVAYEKDKVRIRTEFVPITQEVERVIEKPIYRNVCIDDDGMRLITEAIQGRAAASEPARTVPRPDAAR